jgi:hypothetical protein
MQQETTPSASLRPGTETTTPSDLHLINMTATTLAEVALRLQTVKVNLASLLTMILIPMSPISVHQESVTAEFICYPSQFLTYGY